MSITLKQVEAFLALADTLNFSEAAKAVHLSQPALSASIRRLEEIIGARLFDRDTRKVALSAVGLEFLDMATGVVEHVDHGLARVQDIVRGTHGHLSIAVVPSIAAGILPEVLVRYMARYPHIDLRLHDAMANVCAEMVRSGAADVALMSARDDPDLEQHVLFRDPLVVLCASDHPLASQDNLNWADIIPCKLVVRGKDSSVRQLLDMKYLEHGVILRPAFEVSHVGSALGLIAAGLGIGVVPSSLLSNAKMTGMVSRHFDPAFTSYWTICASTSRARTSKPPVEPFIRLCMDHLKLKA